MSGQNTRAGAGESRDTNNGGRGGKIFILNQGWVVQKWNNIKKLHSRCSYWGREWVEVPYNHIVCLSPIGKKYPCEAMMFARWLASAASSTPRLNINQFISSCPTTTTTSSSAPALQQQQPVRQLLPYNNNQFISSWPGYFFLNNIFLITLMLKFKSNHQENLENINLHIFFYLLVLYFWVQGSIIHTI